MRAVTWQGFEDVRVEDVPDPRIEEPTDAIVDISSTAICGSDLHLYRPLAMFIGARRHPRPRSDGPGRGGRQQMAVRVARHLGVERVFGVDLVPERLAMAERHGAETIDAAATDDAAEALRSLTAGRGPDSVVDAVGMEAHGAPMAAAMQRAAAALPRAVSEPLARRAGMDRLTALRGAIDAVRRGGTLSIIGVYGGTADPLPMLELFDKGVQIRMGQAHVKRWVRDILPLLERDDDVFGLDDRLPLDEAPTGYANFQAKEDETIKVVLRP